MDITKETQPKWLFTLIIKNYNERWFISNLFIFDLFISKGKSGYSRLTTFWNSCSSFLGSLDSLFVLSLTAINCTSRSSYNSIMLGRNRPDITGNGRPSGSNDYNQLAKSFPSANLHLYFHSSNISVLSSCGRKDRIVSTTSIESASKSVVCFL